MLHMQATTESRISFRYRTEGAFARIANQNWLRNPRKDGNNYVLHFPASIEWARVDLRLGAYQPNGKGIDLTRGFFIHYISIYAGDRGQTGACYVDDVVVYDVVPGE
jgi:hypothetical protein